MNLPQISNIPEVSRVPQLDIGLDVRPFLGQIQNAFAQSFDFFRKYDYAGIIDTIKLIGIVLTFISLAIFIMVIYRYRKLLAGEISEIKKDIAPPAEAVSAYDLRWDEIRRHVNSFSESEWKLAVIEGDKFVDDALKTAGFRGESMGERLMMIKPGQIINLQMLWDAHKLRNLLVHDANYQVTHRQAILAIEAFGLVLQELGALS